LRKGVAVAFIGGIVMAGCSGFGAWPTAALNP